jgi:hypothetical protein
MTSFQNILYNSRGRYIGDTIRNILETVEEEDLSCIILSVDFEKAFDSLSWKFLQQCLDYFEFGPSFKKWTSILFQNISSCVLSVVILIPGEKLWVYISTLE